MHFKMALYMGGKYFINFLREESVSYQYELYHELKSDNRSIEIWKKWKQIEKKCFKKSANSP